MDVKFKALNSKEQLLLHQLQIADYWYKKISGSTADGKSAKTKKSKLPEKWELTEGINLYAWQIECLNRYFPSCRGIVKVVTGAGKTFLALALAQKVQNELNPALKVLITVPTIVLLNQWYDILCCHSNLPENAIGRLGGGYSDTLDGKSILIAVNNSVVLKLLPNSNELAKENLMLIVDECHRLRGEVMRTVFDIPSRYSLGLSATPDTGIVIDEDDAGQEEDIVLRELGGIFYTLTYDDAIRQGFLPEFEIQHVGLPLKGDEQTQYRKVSDEITDLREHLLDMLPDAPRGGELSGWAAMMLGKPSVPDEIKSMCAAYTSKVAKRQELLFTAKSREQAVLRLIRDRIGQNGKTQIILFHERIEEIMRLYAMLRKKGIPVVPEHSDLSDSLRAQSIELFRRGTAKVIVSG
ncbi:MAG: DEAD/DEAH box helicase family protein, partial [Lentisphaeria bacterium]|nr:DEAD/DEAH box helicase family protein [Lentisphaeria bacterium]